MIYSQITEQVFTYKSFYLLTLNSFTHSPDMLIIHLIGNILVFMFFGILVELMIGSKRFAIITIITFLSTTIVNYLHTDSIYLGHGASGIAWGYHIFYIFIFILLFENKGKKTIKNLYIILSFALLLFDIIGIPIFEVVIQQRGFFDNFGQVLHLVSMFVVVPFVFLWRRDIESNVKKLMLREPIHNNKNNKSIAILIIIIIVLLNAFGTYKAMKLTRLYNNNLTYSVSPFIETNIVDVPKIIIVNFDKEVADITNIYRTIDYDDKLGKIKVKERWINNKTLQIEFNRRFIKSESIKLIYSLLYEIEDKIYIKDKLTIEY